LNERWRPDLTDVVFREAGAQITAREPVGHDRRPPDGPDEHAGQVARKQKDQEDRSREADPAGGKSTAPGRVGVGLALLESCAGGCRKAPEVGTHRLDAPPSFVGSRNAPRGGVVSPHSVQKRRAVILDIRHAGPSNSTGPGQLDGVVSDEALERACLLGEGSASLIPWLEEALLARDDEPAHACLEVNDVPLELVRGNQSLPGLAPFLRRIAEVGDRKEQDQEGCADDDCEQTTR
jgi:hypothetical protein